jgi:hypothetical protein
MSQIIHIDPKQWQRQYATGNIKRPDDRIRGLQFIACILLLPMLIAYCPLSIVHCPKRLTFARRKKSNGKQSDPALKSEISNLKSTIECL